MTRIEPSKASHISLKQINGALPSTFGVVNKVTVICLVSLVVWRGPLASHICTYFTWIPYVPTDDIAFDSDPEIDRFHRLSQFHSDVNTWNQPRNLTKLQSSPKSMKLFR